MRIIAAWSMLFLSTPSARRATNYAPLLCLLVRYFYPRPPRGGRQLRSATLSSRSVFLSTPSARRATTTTLPICQEVFYFYPRPPRGGRLDYKFKHCNSDCISIHALREEGDSTSMLFAAAFFLFLSTPSARRATCFTMLFIQNNLNFYPRPPRGGRRDRSNARRHQAVFLSTPSARRATAKTETKSLFSYKLYNILHEFRRALIYNGSKNDPNHAKRHKNPVRRCRKNAENSPFAPGRETQNNSRPSCSKGG